MHEDIVDETLISFKINGKEYKYKPVTAGEENDWVNEYVVYDKETNENKQDLSLLNKCKMRNLTNVPYTKEDITELFEFKYKETIDKSWDQLDHDQRWKFISKLKPGIFNKIILAMNGDEDSKEKKT